MWRHIHCHTYKKSETVGNGFTWLMMIENNNTWTCIKITAPPSPTLEHPIPDQSPPSSPGPWPNGPTTSVSNWTVSPMLMRRVPLSCSCHKQSKHWWDIIHCPNGPHCKYCEKVIIWLKIKHGSQSINKIIKIMYWNKWWRSKTGTKWVHCVSAKTNVHIRFTRFIILMFTCLALFALNSQWINTRHSPKKMVAECCRFLILVSNKPWHPHIP